MKDWKKLGVALRAAVVLLAGVFQLSAELATTSAEAACIDVEQAWDDATDAEGVCEDMGYNSVYCSVSCNEDGQMVTTCWCFSIERR